MMEILKTRCTGYSEVITTGAGSFKPQDKAALTDIGTVLIFLWFFFNGHTMSTKCFTVYLHVCTDIKSID